VIESQKDDVDIYLDKRRGWVIRTPMRVPDSALLKMCEHALETYARKLTHMPDGPEKRLLDFCLPLLAKMRVTQEISSAADVNTQSLHSSRK
jgi:hypothetical protein